MSKTRVVLVASALPLLLAFDAIAFAQPSGRDRSAQPWSSAEMEQLLYSTDLPQSVDTEEFRQAMIDFLIASGARRNDLSNLADLVEQLRYGDAEGVELWIKSLPDPVKFMASVRGITDSILVARPSGDLGRATEPLSSLAAPATTALFAPDYAPLTGPGSSDSIYKDVILEPLASAGYISSSTANTERCDWNKSADLTRTITTAQIGAALFDWACGFAGCDPVGLVCASVCGIGGAVQAVFENLVLLGAGCEVQDGGINGAETEAAYENTKIIAGQIDGVTDDLAQVQTSVDGVGSDVDSVQSSVDTLAADLDTHDANIDGDLQQHDADIKSAISTHNTNIDGDLQQHDADIKSAISNHNTNIDGDLQQHDTDIKSAISNHDTNIDGDLQQHDGAIKSALATHHAGVLTAIGDGTTTVTTTVGSEFDTLQTFLDSYMAQRKVDLSLVVLKEVTPRTGRYMLATTESGANVDVAFTRLRGVVEKQSTLVDVLATSTIMALDTGVYLIEVPPNTAGKYDLLEVGVLHDDGGGVEHRGHGLFAVNPGPD